MSLGVRITKTKSALVKQSYNKIAKTYNAQRHLYKNTKLLLKFKKLVTRGACVLDLACGAGVPVVKFLVKSGYNVTGIDFSSSMIKLAKKNVPKAKFLEMDMTKLKFKTNSFDAVVSFYAIIHVPKEKHVKIYKSLHKILKPNGIALVCVGTCDWEETVKDYLGAPMFWSIHAPRKTLELLRGCGFKILWSRVLKLGGEKQFWIIVRNKN